MTLRLGVVCPESGGSWIAGRIYFENLLESLSASGGEEAIVILEPEGGVFARSADGADAYEHFILPKPSIPASALGKARGHVRRSLNLPSPGIRSVIRRSNVDAVFSAGIVEGSPVPCVAWIPDLQHVEYPDFFSAEELESRDTGVARIAAHASLVLLSSEAALHDFAQFAPEHAHKGRVAPFVSLMSEDLFVDDPMTVAEKYAVRHPFAVVPNQWWRHKNHEVVVNADALLKRSGVDVTWVLTGALSDNRGEAHISRILQLINVHGLRDRFAILGALPRWEQVQLMRAASFIVQPSLFEGWSTVVEDAKTLGQRLIISDIPVHREQDPASAMYFDPCSAEDLAANVEAMLEGACPRVDEAGARAASLSRAAVFGKRFRGICAEAGARRQP